MVSQKMTNVTISSNGKYYQIVERNTELISVKWKVLHVTIFVALALDAFISAWAFGQFLTIFNNACVLDAKISFKNRTIASPSNFVPNDGTTKLPLDGTTEPSILKGTEDTTLTTTELIEDESVSEDAFMFRNETMFVFENETYFVESTIDTKRTFFRSRFSCDMLLFTPLSSMIVAAVFGVILIVCSKGGRGYSTDIMSKPQYLAYPIMFISSLFLIVTVVTANAFISGADSFCENFEIFTGTTKCNVLVDIFTIQFNTNKVAFYNYYLTIKCTFYLAIFLWSFQIVVTLMRILCVVDYQFYSLEIKSSDEDTTIQQDLSMNTTELTTTV